MSIVLHDDKGHVCDLSSAHGCTRLRDWMIGAGSSATAKTFWEDGLTDSPRNLATEVAELLHAHPPVDADVANLAKALAKGLRRSHGVAILTQ